jgi:hypothetical protein
MQRPYSWLLLLGIFVGLAQTGKAQQAGLYEEETPNPKIERFIPPHAQIIKHLRISFAHEVKPSIVLAYATKVGEYDYEAGVRVLNYRNSQWLIAYQEKSLVSTGGGNPMAVERVDSAKGNEGLVVILTFSGAGTSTDWHVIAEREHKFVSLDASAIRNRVLRRQGYQFGGYNGVSVRGDTVFEDISGYSHGRARCCPDLPSLELGVKFTGSSLRLASVKTKPLEAQ